MKELTKRINGVVDINVFGLQLKIDSIFLYRETIHPNAHSILDRMIETEYKDLLYKVKPIIWDITPEARKKFEKLTHPIQEILDVATFSRNILPLHSDSESINLNQNEVDIVELSYSFWKYNRIYGFIDSY